MAETPVRIIPATEPDLEPGRRLAPDEVCDQQIHEVTRRVERNI